MDFLEGDPDRPLIVGRVHNADKTAATDLPSDKHKTITRDHGSNKIVMHGKAGTQHVSMISPGSLNMLAMSNSAQGLSADATSGGGASWPTIANNPAADAYTNIQAAVSLANSNSASYSKGQIGMDSNTVTEGEVNTFSYGDNNAWVMGDRNIYVQTNQVSWVQGNDTSTIVGDVQVDINGNYDRTIAKTAKDLVTGDRTTTLKANDTLTVTGDTTVTLTGALTHHTGKAVLMIADVDKTETVGGDSMISVAKKTTITSNGDVAITSSTGTISITAATKLTLSVGGSSIEISASGIKITGSGPVKVTAPMIDLNS